MDKEQIEKLIEVLDAQSVQQYDLSRLLAPPFKRFTQRPLPPLPQN